MGPKCTLSILSNTTVYWENNHASLGGAIYVEDVSPTVLTFSIYGPKQECFFNFCHMILMSNLFSRTALLMLRAVRYIRGVASNEAEEAVAFSIFCARARARIGDII